MLRHLKNANELVLYACVSCAAAFVGRVLPAFYLPILLLRVGVLVYCVVVIAGAEDNKEAAIIIGMASFLGLLGGYFDLLGVFWVFDLANIVNTFTAILVFVAALIIVVLQVRANAGSSKK